MTALLHVTLIKNLLAIAADRAKLTQALQFNFPPLHLRAVDCGVLFFDITLTLPLLWAEDLISRILETAVSPGMKCK